MSSISGLAAGPSPYAQQTVSPPAPPPARKDNDGDEATETATTKASEARNNRVLDITA